MQSLLASNRHLINNAANPLHLEQRLVTGDTVVRYKVAWVGGANVLYDRQKLLGVGGFSWWNRLPDKHVGEEVLAQFLLIRKYGGCGLLPAGTYHPGTPTTLNERGRNATELFGELIEELAVSGSKEDVPQGPSNPQAEGRRNKFSSLVRERKRLD
jgi:hypothetical protein